MSTREAGVVVVGGGLAGLAAAWRLHKRGIDVRVYEACPRVGGFVGSITTSDGFVIEEGPGSTRGDRGTIASLIHEVGLGDAIEPSLPAAKTRYIWAKGAIHALAGSPLSLLKTDLLSRAGKLRLMSEPFRKARREGDPGDETLAAMLTRRIGSEAVAMLVDPFVTGVFAGDPERLGVDAFPGLGELERDHGSLFKGMRAKGGMGGAGIFSLRGGLGTLPNAIAAVLGERIRCGVSVERVRIARHGDAGAGDARELEVVLRDGEVVRARAVIIATPGREAAAILSKVVARAPLDVLTYLPSAPITRVELGVRESDLARPIDGFGLLCASSSPLPDGARSILGIVFASSVFPNRAPAGMRSLSVMLGGMRDLDIGQRTDTQLIEQAVAAARALLGLRGEPVMTHVSRWDQAIPQYQPGHARAIRALRQALPAGIQLAGNYLEGVSVDNVVASGFAAADAVAVY